MNNPGPTLGIVMPCYNEQEILLDTNIKMGHLFNDLIDRGIISSESCLVYVDDGR